MAEPKNESKESRFAKWVASVPWRGGRWDLLLWLVAIFVGVFFGANWVFFARLIPLIRSSLAAEAFKDPGSIAQLVTGLLTFWAGIALAAMWVWRNAISAKEAETSRIQAKVALNTQISSDLAKAYEQLGSEKMSARIGAINILSKIMSDVVVSDLSLWYSVVHSLCTVLREYAKAQTKKNLENGKIQADSTIESEEIFNVLGKNLPIDNHILLNLRGVYLCNFGSSFYSFDNCLIIVKVDFTEANFSNACLNGAIFNHSLFFRSNFTSANLHNTSFQNAVLDWTDFRGALMDDVDFLGAVFLSPDFRGTNVSRARNLTQEQIDAAQGDRHTKLPPGLVRPAHWHADDEDDSED